MEPKHSEAFDSVEQAIADVAAGKLVIVTDDENRENEGDLIIAAEKATPEAINMMLRHARGLICVPVTEHQLRRLGLAQMVQVNRDRHSTAFTVSVDAAEGVTTGISAHDRCQAVRVVGDPKSTGDMLAQPGHVFPLRARPGGVLERAGHTEAAVDLASLAGLNPAAAICEILNEDGSCARLPQLVEFKKKHGLTMISVASLIEYRHRREKLVERIYSELLDTEFGKFDFHCFRNLVDGSYNFALTMGELSEEPTLVRVHSENILTDLFGQQGVYNSGALKLALKKIAEAGRGALVYMSHPCGGLDLPESKSAPVCRLEPRKMDFRGYGVGAQILAELGLKHIRLLTSSPRHVVALDGYGIEIDEQISLDGE